MFYNHALIRLLMVEATPQITREISPGIASRPVVGAFGAIFQAPEDNEFEQGGHFISASTF